MSVERPRPLVAGNWKMNGLKASTKVLTEIDERLFAGPAQQGRSRDLPARAPDRPLRRHGRRLQYRDRRAGLPRQGKAAPSRATSSAEMLADTGATYVIVGHSERRQYHGETDADVAAKAQAAHRAGLVAIVCVGETRAEREAGQTLDVVRRQLAGSVPAGSDGRNLVVAYEPVWAIGTGLTPTAADVAEVHAAIRASLADLVGAAEQTKVRILYGGSVKPANAAELLAVANVDGALVGGASLVAADFLGIAGAYVG